MSRKFIIKKITVISGSGVNTHCVGENGVTQILDKSMEYESSIEFIYAIFVNGYQRFQLINCPVEIEYDDTI